MRAARLVAALLILQARGRVSAAELARELEVSVKTARRDLEALAIAGVPVYAHPGRHGGWSLVGGARTDLSGLTAAEARTLFLLAGPSTRLAPAGKAALRKLVRALPEPFRADASAAARATVIDPLRWGAVPASVPPAVTALREAVIAGVQVRLRYADRAGSASERVVNPLGLVEKASVWYLVAGAPEGLRTFRVDRIHGVELTNEPVDRPADFDLDAAWEASRRRVETLRRAVTAVVHVDRSRLARLIDQFGGDLAIVARRPDGRIEVEIRRDSVETLANELAGWGDDIEVVSPDAVRRRLAALGAELVGRYALSRGRGRGR